MKKKAQGLSMNTIIIAALVLIVLIVLVMIFKTQISDVSKGFTGISKDAQKKAEESKGSLSDLFGKCEEGEKKCNLNSIMICKNGAWDTEEDCGKDKICKDNECQEKSE